MAEFMKSSNAISAMQLPGIIANSQVAYFLSTALAPAQSAPSHMKRNTLPSRGGLTGRSRGQ
jgi:hypothetical protein